MASNALPQAIFWDLDGTLVDSEPLWGQATYEMSEAMGARLTPELRERTVGGSFDNTFRICAAHAGLADTSANRAHYREVLHSRAAELFDAHITPIPGARELLTELSNAGVRMALTTNTPRQLARFGIRAVGENLFDAIWCGDDVARPKPSPDIYTQAAAHFGLAPHECLVCEDSQAGMTAARRAGCWVLGIVDTRDEDLPHGVVSLGSLTGSLDYTAITPEHIAECFNALLARGYETIGDCERL